MGRVRKVCGGILGVLGVALFVIGVVVKWSIFPQVMEDLVYENLKLEKGTEGWDAFVVPPVPVYMKFYFFNVDNAANVTLFGAKPFLSEKGPYVYKENRRKEDLLTVDGDKLHYSQYMDYTFDQEMSEKSGCVGCSDEDKFVVLNGALAGVAALVGPLLSQIPPEFQTYVPLILSFVDNILSPKPGSDFEPYREELFKEIPVKELLFDGYETGLLKALFDGEKVIFLTINALLETIGFPPGTTIEESLTTLQTLLDTLAPGSGIDVKAVYDSVIVQLKEIVEHPPDQIAGGTFGIFKGKNATKANSYYVINTGKYEKHNFMELEEVNGKEKLPDDWWPNVAPTPTGQDAGLKGICHEIYGTDGQQFPPFVDKETRIWIYVGELCRSLWMDFDSEIELHGVPVYRYRPANDVFAMSNPNNFCYCPYFDQCATRAVGKDEWDTTKCTDICKDGMLYVGTCYGGAPIVMTTPHFYLADRSLIEAVDGMSEPEIAKHETSLDVEPITGATMAAHKRIQINMPLVKIDGLTLLSKVPELIFPIMWADETAELDEENADKFKSMVLVPSKIVDGVAIGIGMVLGAILFFVGLFLIIWKGKSSYKS